MRHAQAAALASVEDVLAVVRARPELTERKPGIFYKKTVAFLHFHEDPAGLFADLKRAGGGWERYAVNTPEQHEALIRGVTGALGG